MTLENGSSSKKTGIVYSIRKKRALFSFLLLLLALPVNGADEINPALLLGGSRPTDGLVISTTATDFTRTVQIINTTNAKISVTVELPDLIGPDSKSVRTSWQLNGNAGTLSTDIEGQQAARLEIKANLPGAGLYESTISLIYNSKRFPIPLKITRTSTPPTISVVGLDPVAFRGFDNERAIRFSLREASGVPVVLHSPSLLSLTRKLGEKSFQADYGAVEFYRVKSDGKLDPIVDSVQIGAHESVVISMKVTGVFSPGEYVGSVAVSSNDGALPVQAFTFFLKLPWWLCALLIAIGVTISHWLRNYVKNGRPRLILARRIVLLRQDFDLLSEQLTDQQDKDLINSLRQRLDRAADEVDISDASAVEPILNDLNLKLSLVPLWSTLRRRIDLVQPPSDAEAARNELANARDFLETNKNHTEAEINAIRDKLRAALTSINDVIRQRLVADVGDVVKMAKEARGDLSAARQNEFDTRVISTLDAATAEIQKTPPNADEARRLINNARVAYATIMADDLSEKMATVSKPVSMTEPEWSTLKTNFETNLKKAHQTTDGVTAIKAYKDVYAAYLRVLIDVARKTLSEIQPRADATGTQPQKDLLTQARQNLDTADSLLRNGELDQVQASYEAAKSVLDQAVIWFPPAQAMSASSAKPASLSSIPLMRLIPGLGLGEFAEPSQRRGLSWLKLDDLKQKLRTRDLIVTLLVGAAAVVLGLYNIWIDNPAWGTGKDLFVAVLWGLGLHQLAGNFLFARLDLTQLARDLTGKEGG